MNKELRKFGFSFGLGLNILGYVMFYRGKGHFIWFSCAGSLALFLAILRPSILAPLKKAIDSVILAVRWLVASISLIIVFYLIFSPLGILLKIFGKDLLNQRIDKKAGSYWIKRKENIFSKESYEQMG